MAVAEETKQEVVALGQPKVGFRIGMLGMASPVFPGFECDILDRTSDDEKADAIWHRDRAKAMIRAHPEIKDLFEQNAGTAFWCLLFAGGQVALAAATVFMPLWLIIPLAWVIGSWFALVMFQLAHECDHCRVFKTKLGNRLLFTATTLPMFLSGHHTWWVDHLVHHNEMGARKDFISRRRTYYLSTRTFTPLIVPFPVFMLVMQVLRSSLGLLMYVGCLLKGQVKPGKWTLAVLTDEHLVSVYKRDKIEWWAVFYPAMAFVMYGLLIWWGFSVAGWSTAYKPILFLLLSMAFMSGWAHPGMFGIGLGLSHMHGHTTYQPSASNYNPLFNLLTFGVGYHVEHHDLMGIPWYNLPKLRPIAPEYFDDLEMMGSYTLLALDFTFASRKKMAERYDDEAHRIARRSKEAGAA